MICHIQRSLSIQRRCLSIQVEIWKQNELDQHFENAKKLLLLATKLVHPDPNLPIALRTDASKIGLGAVLETYQNGQWRPLVIGASHYLLPNKNIQLLEENLRLST